MAAAVARIDDNFNDNVIDPVLWRWCFGVVSETGGRARVGCSTAYAAYVSDYIYSLKESSVHVRLFPPAAGGATAEALAQLVVSSTPDGTDTIMEVNAATGLLRMANRVDYFDGSEVSIPYSATNHAWLRIREAAGTTYWETSPDGVTWTTRRSSVSPAWVIDNNLKFQLLAHRNAGTVDFAEFDDLRAGATTSLSDITVTIGPTRIRELATVGPTRAGVGVGPTRGGLAIDETRDRPLVTAGPTRTGLAVNSTRTGLDVDDTRTGLAVGPTRRDRGA